jgi:hypothetical protein
MLLSFDVSYLHVAFPFNAMMLLTLPTLPYDLSFI